MVQRNRLVKFLQFNNFLFVVFAGKEQPKQVGKMLEIKKINLEVMTTIFEKISAKSRNVEISSLRIFGEVTVSEF